jgi:hypothetical protein
MIEGRKRAVSIRMNWADVERVKKLAARLNVRDSDVIRFAVKGMLGRLGPLYEPESRGRNLIPVLVEAGSEFLRFFDLDTTRLDSIVNRGAEADKRVARDDLALLALSGMQEPYAALKLSELNQAEDRSLRAADLSSSLRQYLYDKYVYRPTTEAVPAPAAVRLAVAAGGHHE